MLKNGRSKVKRRAAGAARSLALLRAMIDLANFYRGMDPSFAAVPVPEASPCALLGPAGSGRSSMLFQYALQVAMGGGRVLYISGKEQSRPLLPARLDEDEEVEEAFGRIGLKYITAAQDLQMYFASMAAPPDLLVVDSWTDILPPCVTPAEPRAHDRRALTAHTLPLLRRATTAADSALKTMALLHNATAPRDPPGGASSSGSPGTPAPQTVCLIGGTDDSEAEVHWWQRCPLVLKLGAPRVAPGPALAAFRTVH
jgi:hypothetical protein